MLPQEFIGQYDTTINKPASPPSRSLPFVFQLFSLPPALSQLGLLHVWTDWALSRAPWYMPMYRFCGEICELIYHQVKTLTELLAFLLLV